MTRRCRTCCGSPLGDGILLKARDTWPRTAKVYCHRVEEWPEDAEVVERVPVRSCVRRGAAIDLVLDRARENRSQFVITMIRGGRQAIFWQTSRTAKQARPRATVSSARAQGIAGLEIVVDSHERYPWSFGEQQVTTRRQSLPVGDYAVLDGELVVAAVERKGLPDLVSSLTAGKLKYQLTELSSVPRAAVVVEERYSRALQHEMVRAAVVADGLAEAQVAFPGVPIMFCETRKLAQEWTYRFLAAAYAARELDGFGATAVSGLAEARPLPPREPTPKEIRAWAVAHGYAVSDRGRVPADVRAAYLAQREA
ncbi:histone-like nucleoid-structuring protein Lsr2 [Nocardioides sp. TF02-7]|uniref:ERCC4 domain-containing protein n=1 Tax=Nocardioides sp. TF02-7 TaxID=2917724 RepID=UPI001F064A9E|nr:histone-like nucleoid-structuring protein Lsr2 [Nocardioides sp. TF02-7]UMG93547.1 Lsr2 family protein [Nocardioides sp. TF02-7]